MTQSRTRLRLLTLVAVIAIPALLLLGAEAGLRLAGYGHPAGLTVPCTVGDRPARCDNDRFTRQFFPPGAFRLPPAFAIPDDKPAGTFRIFVVGESAAQGDPEPSYSFARYLEAMLRDWFPAVRFEVVNTGIAAINSHALLPAVRDLAKREPDLFVLYIGNNEVVGPYGAGTILTPRGTSLPLIRAAILLNSTRLGQLVGAGLRAVTGGGGPRSWRGMEMFLEQQVPAGDPALAGVYRNFRRNLSDIVDAARGSGARVLVGTVAVNLKDSAPFAALHGAALDAAALKLWETHVEEGAALSRAGRHADAVERYLAAERLDARHADLQFRLARGYWALGEFPKAKERFQRARELDALRFRADSRINGTIRSVAAAAGPGVELLDAERILAEASPHGVPGGELFWEHVHLRPRGNYLIARAIFPHVVALLPPDARGSASAVAPTQAAADSALALTGFDRARVVQLAIAWLGQPPFTAQLTRDEQVAGLRRELADLREPPAATAAAYRRALDRAPADRWLQFNHGVFLEAYGELAAAEVSYRRALAQLPGNYAASDKVAGVLARQGKYAEAIAQCRGLLERMPYHPTAYMTLGYALAQTGALEESVAAYRRAGELHPPYAPEAWANIGLIRLHEGRFGPAAASLEKALAMEGMDPARRAGLQEKLSYAREREAAEGR